MSKLIAVIVTICIALSTTVAMQADANQTVECDGNFPIFHTTAATEEENHARIACVEDRRQVIKDRIAERRAKKSDLTDRIKTLKKRRATVIKRIERDRNGLEPLTEVNRLLRYVTGYIAWLNTTSTCESHNDPQAHSASGTYHGKLQFHLRTWNSLQWAARYGNDDPHTEPAIVQDAGGIELLRRDGDEQWPRCGD